MKKYRQHSIKFNFVMNIIQKMSGMWFSLASYPYALRVLGVDSVGQVAFSISVASFFSMFAALGIPTYGVRECAKVRDNRSDLAKTVQELLIIQTISTVASALLFGMTVLSTPRLREDMDLYLIHGTALLFSAVSAEWMFAGLEEYGYITLRTTLSKIICLVLIFLLVHSPEDYLVYAVLSIGATAIANIINIVELNRYVPWKHISGHCEIKKHLRPIFVFFAQTVAITVYTNFDSAMLGFMQGDYQVGLYDVAVKVKLALSYFVTSLGNVLLPRLSYYLYNKRRENYQLMLVKALEFTVVTAMPLMIFFFVMAPECIEVLSGSLYTSSATAMRVLIPTILFIGLSSITGTQMLVPAGKENVAMISYISGAVVDVLLNAILIPRFASVGAAIGTLAAELTVLAVQVGYLRGAVLRTLQKVCLLIPIVAAIIPLPLLVAIKCMKGISVTMTFFAGGILYALVWGACLIWLREPLACGVWQHLSKWYKKKRRDLD